MMKARPPPIVLPYTSRYSPQLAPVLGARSKRLYRPIGEYETMLIGLPACAPSLGRHTLGKPLSVVPLSAQCALGCRSAVAPLAAPFCVSQSWRNSIAPVSAGLPFCAAS